MAKTEFKTKEPKKVALAAAKKTANALDDKNSAFHIPAPTGTKLTLNGEFYEQAWESFDEKGKQTGSGTTILVGVEELQKPLRLSFFRSKSLKEEDGKKPFKAAFPLEAGFEEMIDTISASKGKQVIVTRSDYVFPGRASARSIDLVDWVK